LHFVCELRPSNVTNFVFRACHQNDAARLQAFLLSLLRLAFWVSVLIDELPPQPKSRRSASAAPKTRQAALPGNNFGGQLAAIFAGHRPLHNTLYSGGADAAAILELHSATLDRNAGLTADEFVVGAVVCIEKPLRPSR
jgi:hypothetical protein